MTIQLKSKSTDKLLELGGGARPLVRPNLDIRPCYDEQGRPTVDIVANLEEPLPIQDQEYDGIFCQYALEHVTWRKVPQFIGEMYRILKPGGKVVIVTANTEAQIKWIRDHPTGWDDKSAFESFSGVLFGDCDYPENSHKSYFNVRLLHHLFHNASFENIKIQPYGARDTDLVVEANRPVWKGSLVSGPIGTVLSSQIADASLERILAGGLPDTEIIHFSKNLHNHEALCGAGFNISATLLPENVTCEKCEELLILHGNPFAPKSQGIMHSQKETRPNIFGTNVGKDLPQQAGIYIKTKAVLQDLNVMHERADFPDQNVVGERAVEKDLNESGERAVQTDSNVGDERAVPSDSNERGERAVPADSNVIVERWEGSQDPSSSLPREELFDKAYFNGGGKVGGYAREGYRDFPAHEITFQHIMIRRPESVLEIGAARGYILKRLQDAGIRVAGLEISKHCYLSRALEDIFLHDICKVPWPIPDQSYDLCFSIATLEHIPEEFLPGVLGEIKRTCKRSLHGIDFGEKDDGFDKTHCTLRPLSWWQLLFSKHGLRAERNVYHELLNKEELEQGKFPEEVLKGDGKVKLNIGCFTTMFHHGWINIDIQDVSHFAQLQGYTFQHLDVRNGLPYPTGGVDLIFLCHFLEHLTYTEARTFLKECRRVLKPEGAMRILVPDAQLLVKKYIYHPHPMDVGSLDEFDEISDGATAAPTVVGKLWELLFAGHQAAYDQETLTHYLQEASFDPRPTFFRKTKTGEQGEQILRETIDMMPALSLFCDCIPLVG